MNDGKHRLLLGDEAVGLGAIDAGISGAFSYPGTPATEILEFVQKTAGTDVASRWSPNEKVAYEEALGVSYMGRRALVSMKHVGLNVAADPFINSALTGANGGLVLVVADDPGMHSSQNEQDSRFFAEFAQVPLLEPADQQECYDMTREAFALSEHFGLPVVVRLVTRLSHSRAVVTTRESCGPDGRCAAPADSHDWILMPDNARRRFRRLLDLQPQLLQWSEESNFNRLTLRGGHGIMACGLGYEYVHEAILDDHSYSLLRISTYPIPVRLVRELLDHCEEVLIVEEGYPFVEDRLRGLLGVPGKFIRGKRNGVLPLDGELTAASIRGALKLPGFPGHPAVADLPPRPPALCSGCPHCDTFMALNEALKDMENPRVFSDIGCYTLAALPPYNAVHTCVDMGASLSMALGAAKVGAHPVIATIGDSTFTHSGLSTLLSAAAEDAPMTVIIMDNSAVGMTGCQEVFLTGEQFIPLLVGLGVDRAHVHLVEPFKKYHETNVALLRREIEHRGLSVIVASRPCIHIKRRAGKTQSGVVDDDKVEKCSVS